MSKKHFIHLTFLEPYRLAEWHAKADRKKNKRYLRGMSFAQWHKDKDGIGKPYITGTLLRSAVLNAAEELISLNQGMWAKEPCCNGKFETEKDKPAVLRKRPTIQWKTGRPAICDPEKQEKKDACPLCMLLGRFDKAGKRHRDNKYDKHDYDIHFDNLNLITDKKFSHPDDIASERILNRVDYTTGKAHDYFKVWEVDDDQWWQFTGTITMHDDCSKAKGLLLASLCFVDKLCGALCRIEVTGNNSQDENKEYAHPDTGIITSLNLKYQNNSTIHQDAVPLSGSAHDNDEPPVHDNDSSLDNDTITLLSMKAKEIVGAFHESGKIEKARTLADVIRAMRLQKPDIWEKLPKGINDKHHLWDREVNGKKLRNILEELWRLMSKRNAWRTFCEVLENELYRCYKEKTGGIVLRFRTLGETEYYPEPEKTEPCLISDNSIPITPLGGVKEWIIIGRLKAETPFYFGAQSSFDSTQDDLDLVPDIVNTDEKLEANEQTSFRILMDKKGRYRIPRSLIRGVLRRDLRTAFGGSGCIVELGRMIPCDCKVCAIMRKITVMDSRSENIELPDIRYRIRLNPYTATVDEGALFDMEIGPEGITFPFVFRYRGEDALPRELWSVIRYWMDGMAWLGGSGSTGKGRFALIDIKVFEWDLCNEEGLKAYICSRGLRGIEKEVLLENKTITEITNLFKTEEVKFFESYSKHIKQLCHEGIINQMSFSGGLRSYHEYLSPLWTEVKYEIKIASPLLSSDTISALLNKDNIDCIAYEKRKWENGGIKFVPTIKGETIRGIVRMAVGKRSGDLGMDDHEDCSCTLCTIFGNEHEAGKLRFEDLEVVEEKLPSEQNSDSNKIPFGPVQDGDGNREKECVAEVKIYKKKLIDHVAIDRFHGGAEDKMKFNTLPLVGSPERPIILKGRFWIKKDMVKDYRKKIEDAMVDIRDGLYPIGGKTGIGYGWVTDLTILNPQSGFQIPVKKDISPEPGTYLTYPSYSAPSLNRGHIYYPHYFLAPANTVHREQEMIGHEQFHKEQKGELLVSGKIVCTLKTVTPLIIPDTENEDAFGLQNTYSGHKNYQFFHINDEIMVPGSEIRGMISSVYEAITNSCFRVYDETKYITRRLSPEKKDESNDKNKSQDDASQKIRKGLVKKTDEGFSIIEVERYSMKTKGRTKLVDKVYRLPLYDSEAVIASIKFEQYGEKNEKRNAKILAAIKRNNVIAEVARKNLIFLRSLTPEELKKVLQGEILVKFSLKSGENPNDYLAELHENGTERGLIKFTGLNMVNIKNVNEEDKDFNDTWDWEKLNIFHNAHEKRNSLKQGYPRPVLKFIKDRVEYTIPKRCERIFCIPVKNTIEYKVSSKVCKQYKDVLSDYEKNFGHINKIFTTKIQKRELTDGDLVYFIPNEGADKTAQAIMPVPLSRITDSRTLGERLPHKNLLPCVHEVNEGLLSGILDSLDKKLLSIHPEGLCPTCRLFGTTYYKGRVRFGFANLINKPKWLTERENGCGGYVTLPLLERPRLTWSVPSDKCDVPGRKFYVHHNGWQEVLRNNDITPKTENNRTVEPLAADNRFTFDVYFENLREWELGLLCYCLELEPGMGHKLGMGKPLGFGSVKIAIERLQTFTVHQDDINWKPSENEIGVYVQRGREKLVEWFTPSDSHKNMEWNEVKHIKDLRSLLSIPDDKPTVKYPALNKGAEGAISDYTYERLSDTKLLPHDKRVEYLRTPWGPWNAFVKEAEYSTSENSDEKGRETIRTKPKSLPSVKSIGKVKWFDEGKGFGILIMDDGKEVSISKNSIRGNNLLKKDQKVTFHIVQGLIPKAEDIEIAK